MARTTHAEILQALADDALELVTEWERDLDVANLDAWNAPDYERSLRQYQELRRRWNALLAGRNAVELA